MLQKVSSSLAPASVPLKCPRLDPKAVGLHHDQGEVPVKLPCMWMHHLSSSSASNLVFESIFGSSNLENFWEAMPMEDKRLKGHPMLKKHNWKRRCIPLLLHADAAEFQPTDSLMTVSFRGLLSSEPGREEHLWIFSYPKNCTAHGENGTEHTLYSWVAWSLKALLENKWPDTDPFGYELQPPHPRVGKEILPNNYLQSYLASWVTWNFSKMAWA